MCGFSVAISMNSRKHIPFSNLKKMNEMIAHRGPDKESYFENTNGAVEIEFHTNELWVSNLFSEHVNQMGL